MATSWRAWPNIKHFVHRMVPTHLMRPSNTHHWYFLHQVESDADNISSTELAVSTSQWSLTDGSLHSPQRERRPCRKFWKKTEVVKGQLPSLRSESSDPLSHLSPSPVNSLSPSPSLELLVKINGVYTNLLANCIWGKRLRWDLTGVWRRRGEGSWVVYDFVLG